MSLYDIVKSIFTLYNETNIKSYRQEVNPYDKEIKSMVRQIIFPQDHADSVGMHGIHHCILKPYLLL